MLPDEMRSGLGSLTIREAERSDFKEIAECYWPDPEDPWDIYSNPKLLERFMGPKGFLVAEIRGRVVGFVHYRAFRKRPWFDPKVKGYGQILELHVRAGYRGKGIGRLLTERAVSRLDQSGCGIIYTHTDETNKSALKLYRNLGFRPFLKTF